MPTLPLAVGIADVILAAARERTEFDVHEMADELMREYPAEEVSRDDVAEALREEALSIGISAAAYC